MTRCSTVFAFPPDSASRSGFLRALARCRCAGALVPVVAAHLWHLGVLVGLVGIFVGDSTGFQWLEFPRGGSSLLFFCVSAAGLVGDDEFFRPSRKRIVSVALVPGHRAVPVPVDLFDRQYFHRRLAGARRGAGRHRVVVRQQSGLPLDEPRRPRRGVLFPAEIQRPAAAKLISTRCSRSGRCSSSVRCAVFRWARPFRSGCRP